MGLGSMQEVTVISTSREERGVASAKSSKTNRSMYSVFLKKKKKEKNNHAHRGATQHPTHQLIATAAYAIINLSRVGTKGQVVSKYIKNRHSGNYIYIVSHAFTAS